MTLTDILSKLQKVKKQGAGYTALCPAHEDAHNSLSLSEKGEKIVLFCHAGCTVNSICAAIDIKVSDLFSSPATNGNAKTKQQVDKKSIKTETVTVYSYRDESGKVLFENVKLNEIYSDGSTEKTFRQRHFENGREVWGLNGTRRIPYNLPELLASTDETIYLSEGEKDEETVKRNGFTASSFKNWKAEFNQYLKGELIVLFADHDAAGIKQANDAANVIQATGKIIKVIDLFESEPLPEKHGKDITDWFEIGHTKAELAEIVKSAPIYVGAKPFKIGMTFGELEKLELPKREEIICGLARCENGIINAVTNVGKSTLIRILALCLICGREFLPLTPGGRKMKVAIIDSEDTLTFLRSDIAKMIAGFTDVEKNLVKENLLLICDVEISDEPLRINKKDHFDALHPRLTEFKPDIIFVDTISQSFVISNENDNSEVKERVMKPLKRLARLTDAAVLAAHHIGKAKLEEGQTREGSHRGRGASAFGDQSRIILNLEKAANGDIVLSCPKLKGEKFQDTGFKYDKDTRWLIKQNEPEPMTNYEMVMKGLEVDKQYKRSEIEVMFAGKVTRSTLTRVLKDAVERGDLFKDKLFYTRNAQMLTPYSDEHLSISCKGNNNNGLAESQKESENSSEHFFDESENDSDPMYF